MSASVSARPPLRPFPALALALAAGIALAACQPERFRETRAFPSPESLRGLEWKCHTVFAGVTDSLSGSGALDVETFRGDYPGMEWNWLAGDWRGYDSLCFSARLRAADSAGSDDTPGSADTAAPVTFALSVWDGREPYAPANRFSARFPLGSRWTRQCLDIRGGLETAGGFPLRLRRVRRVAFFAVDTAPPLAFRLGDVRLVKGKGGRP